MTVRRLDGVAIARFDVAGPFTPELLEATRRPPAPESEQIYSDGIHPAVPVADVLDIWRPRWRTERGLRIPYGPVPEPPGPDGGVILDPATPAGWGLRVPSGLAVPPDAYVGFVWLGSITQGGQFRPSFERSGGMTRPGFMEFLASVAGEISGTCPCPYCQAELRQRDGLETPEPIYDPAVLPDSPVDNDFDPVYGVRAHDPATGLLLDDLLDESTKEFIRKRDAKRGQN